MTFILPEGEAKIAIAGVIPGLTSLWSVWPTGFSPHDVTASYASYAAAHQALWEQSMQLMLLPFNVLTAAAVAQSSADDAPSVAVTAAPPAPVTAMAVAGETLSGPALVAPAPATTGGIAHATSVVKFAAAPAGGDEIAGSAPKLLSKPDGAADNLILIKGIGPKLNQLLNSLGVWHFRQIVDWTPAEVSWVNAKIDFRGRIQRENWQPQAAELMKTSQAA